jgi:hypothetical protein
MTMTSFEKFEKKLAEDESNIGTSKYQGIAYFWSTEYKHYLRSSSDEARRKVHNDLLASGLPLDGESPAHEAIVFRYRDDPEP